MNKYKIFEGNMERLEKKLTRISNKCKKYGNEFHFEVIGDEYKEKHVKIRTGVFNKEILHYFVIEVEGTAKVNDWEFIATLEHTGNGNIIKGYGSTEVPKKYYTCLPVCEHCKTNHYRKNTYIIMNEKTGEFKQVGRNCLADFTGGLSAESIAAHISFYDELINGEEPYTGVKIEKYVDIDTALCYAAETVEKFGYVKSDCTPGQIPTKQRALEYYLCNYNGNNLSDQSRVKLKKEMEDVSFNAETEEIKILAKNVKEWILKQDDDNNYFHNLKTICGSDYVKYDNFGILASVFPCYRREMEKEAERERIRKNDSGSVYVGEIGDRIKVEIDSYKIVTSYETNWGFTMIYKLYGNDGNIYIWKTNKGIGDSKAKKIIITGTIKAHNEYNGIKQTELTRCRVAYA